MTILGLNHAAIEVQNCDHADVLGRLVDRDERDRS
jgi:hypothetical protein